MKHVVFAAYSGIAEATCRELVNSQSEFYLVGRKAEELRRMCDDLKIRGAARAIFAVSDLARCEEHAQVLEQIEKEFGGFDSLILAQGVLGSAERLQVEPEQALSLIQINLMSCVSLLTHIFQQIKKGKAFSEKPLHLCVFSSIAGDRARMSNYVYGASKAGLTFFLEGLRFYSDQYGFKVLIVKPGPVVTPMTEKMKKGLTFASPQFVAKSIARSIREGREGVLYTPRIWQLIMLVIRALPFSVLRKLKI